MDLATPAAASTTSAHRRTLFLDVAHTVTFDSGPVAVADIPATSMADSVRTFATAGTYTWHCSIHPYMHGTLVVQ
jgi:plastocyanin